MYLAIFGPPTFLSGYQFFLVISNSQGTQGCLAPCHFSVQPVLGYKFSLMATSSREPTGAKQHILNRLLAIKSLYAATTLRPPPMGHPHTQSPSSVVIHWASGPC